MELNRNIWQQIPVWTFISTGAYYLAIAFKKWGVSWRPLCIQCRIQEDRTPEPDVLPTHQRFTGFIPDKKYKGSGFRSRRNHFRKLTACRTINLTDIVRYWLCRRKSGMEGHTQKYHMSDNADWPGFASGNSILYIPGNCAASRCTIAAQYLQTTGKPIDGIEAYQTTQRCRRMII